MKYLFETDKELEDFLQDKIKDAFDKRFKTLIKKSFLVFLIGFIIGFGVCLKYLPKDKKPLSSGLKLSLKSSKYNSKDIPEKFKPFEDGLTDKEKKQLEEQVKLIDFIEVPLGSDNTPSVKAFMDTIAWAEGTYKYGYKTHYGGFKTKQSLNSYFPCYVYKPHNGIPSSACGKYQILNTTWHGVSKQIKAKSFNELNQEKACLYLLKTHVRVLPIVKYYGDAQGIKNIEKAFYKSSRLWASLPKDRSNKSYYRNQKAKKINQLLYVYKIRYNTYIEKDLMKA